MCVVRQRNWFKSVPTHPEIKLSRFLFNTFFISGCVGTYLNRFRCLTTIRVQVMSSATERAIFREICTVTSRVELIHVYHRASLRLIGAWRGGERLIINVRTWFWGTDVHVGIYMFVCTHTYLYLNFWPECGPLELFGALGHLGASRRGRLLLYLNFWPECGLFELFGTLNFNKKSGIELYGYVIQIFKYIHI